MNSLLMRYKVMKINNINELQLSIVGKIKPIHV